MIPKVTVKRFFGELNDHLERVKVLEAALQADIEKAAPDIAKNRFLSYIQLHEFEALLYTDLNALRYDYLTRCDNQNIDHLIEATKDMMPEEINHGMETAPSK